jgi:hypothetical protein
MSLEPTIARLILSTRRNKRPFDLIQVYNDFQILLNNGYSVRKISKILGISAGMINKFLSIKKLAPQLEELVRERVIDSVALVHNLVKFSNKDQLFLTKAIEEDKISTHDVRVLAPLRKSNPEDDLEKLINRLINSKDRQISVIRIPKETLLIDISIFTKLITDIVRKENFEEIVSNKDYYDLKISKKGELLLRKLAKTKKISLSKLINELLK